MSYRTELQELVTQLRDQSNRTHITEAHREKLRRQAEVLDFLVNHPADAVANLDA